MKHLIALFILICLACSNERLDPFKENVKPPVDQGSGGTVKGDTILMKDYFTKNFNTKFNVGTPQDLPFKTPKGSLVYFDLLNLETLDGKSVSFPIDIEILEMYTMSDMVKWNKPTMSGDKILASGGEIYIMLSKDGKQLRVKNGRPPLRIVLPVKNIDREMQNYSAKGAANVTPNWVLDNMVIVTNYDGVGKQQPLVIGQAYEIFTTKFGWINVDKLPAVNDSEKKQIGFLPTKSQEQVYVFLLFPALNSVMNITGQKSVKLPKDLKVKMVAFSVNKAKETFLDIEEFQVTADFDIQIDLNKYAEAEFLDIISKL